MLCSILIGLESSASGVAAQELSIRWARQSGARLVGLTIVDDPGIQLTEEVIFGDAPPRPVGRALVAEARIKVSAGLRAVQDRFRRRCGEDRVEFALVEGIGSPHVQVLLEAQKHDLIVLGQRSHFEFGWEGKSGETVEKVLKDSPRPLVVVPESPGGGESVVVAYDGSLQASRALAAFTATGLGLGHPVHVVAAAHASNRPEAESRTERAVAFLQVHGIEATPRIVESQHAAAELILKEARRLDAGLLVMGAYGQPVLREFFVGSVTRTILKETPVPIFCYH